MKMLPAIMTEHAQSNAERKVFDMLKKLDFQGTVLHSLNITKHKDQIYGEIDFVIICREGILCLEIKGGHVEYKDGMWHYTDGQGIVHKNATNPFKQASDGKDSLRGYILNEYHKQEASPIKNCVYGHGVVFPDMRFGQVGPEINNDIIFDQRYSEDDLLSYISKLFDYWKNKIITMQKQKGIEHHFKILKENDIEQAVQMLRREFSAVVPTLTMDFSLTDQQLLSLDEEQYKIFKYGIRNPRQLVEGGAGTGKTIIAVEYALEQARKGKKVLLLCFNLLIAEWIKKDIQEREKKVLNPQQTPIEVASFHQFIADIAGIEMPEHGSDEFYKEFLPEKMIEYAECVGIDQFDTVILDEGQDLFLVEYLYCIDKLIKGGLETGNWMIFYDTNQNIYLKDRFDEGLEMLLEYKPYQGYLAKNYRNTRQVDHFNTQISHIASEEFGGTDGEEVWFKAYETKEEVKKYVKEIIKDLVKQKVKLEDIVILSRHRFETSSLDGDRNFLTGIGSIQPMKSKRGELTILVPGSVRFSSIYGFKGMEAHVVILIDLDNLDDNTRKLYYTAISRAKSRLYVLYDAGIKELW